MLKYKPTISNLFMVDFDTFSCMPNEADSEAYAEIDVLDNLIGEGCAIVLSVEFFKRIFPALSASYLDLDDAECESILFVCGGNL